MSKHHSLTQRIVEVFLTGNLAPLLLLLSLVAGVVGTTWFLLEARVQARIARDSERRALQAADYETTVVDYSNDQLKMLRRFGLSAYYGDATRPDLLHAAGIENAKILVIAIDNKEAATELARYMREHHPQVHVIARAIDRWHVYDLWSAGCRDIIRETYDSSIRAARSAFEALGHTRAKAEQLVGVFEEFDRRTMLETAQAFIESEDPHADDSEYSRLIRNNLENWETELKTSMKRALGKREA